MDPGFVDGLVYLRERIHAYSAQDVILSYK